MVTTRNQAALQDSTNQSQVLVKEDGKKRAKVEVANEASSEQVERVPELDKDHLLKLVISPLYFTDSELAVLARISRSALNFARRALYQRVTLCFLLDEAGEGFDPTVLLHYDSQALLSLIIRTPALQPFVETVRIRFECREWRVYSWDLREYVDRHYDFSKDGGLADSWDDNEEKIVMLKRYGCHAHEKAIKLIEVCKNLGKVEYSIEAEGRLPRVVRNWANGKKRNLAFETFQYWEEDLEEDDFDCSW